MKLLGDKRGGGRSGWLCGLALAALLLLAAGCTQERTARSVGTGDTSSQAPATQFRPLATARQLGAEYQAAGAARGVDQLYSDAKGRALLVVMQAGAGLWVEPGQAGKTTPLAFDRQVLAVDMARQQAFALASNTPGENIEILQRALPAGEWQPLLAAGRTLPRGHVFELLLNPATEDKLLLLRSNFSPGGSAEADSVNPVAGQVKLWDCAYRIDAAGNPELFWQRTLLLPVDDMLAPPSAALLSDGSLAYCAPDGAELEIFPADRSGSKRFPLAPGRRCRLSADAAQPVVWAYVSPENSGSGTHRASESVQVGTLLVYGAQGELDRMACGQVPMGSFSGDWDKRRCVLCQPSVGVAIADFARRELRWPLRQSGSKQLYLAGGGSQVLNVLPEAIVGLGVDDLAALGSALAANQVLPLEDLKQVRPVAEGLGWDWASTQISPMLASTGRLMMFDGRDVASSLAEFEWDKQRQRVKRLLLTRVPGNADEELLGLDEVAVDEKLTRLLRKMGWPRAARDPERGFRAEGELQVVYALEPDLSVTPGPGADALVPVSPGEFSLWITRDAALWSLEPAGEKLPAGSLSTHGSREQAHKAALQLAQADGLSAPELRVGFRARGLWVAPDPALAGSEHPLAEAEQSAEGSRAAVELEVLASDAQQDRLYRLLLDAKDGALLQSSGRDAGALLLTQAGQLFGPADEFAAAPAEDSH